MAFFIIGNPRSGTSLFRIILNNHSNIVVPPESGFLLWWSIKYKNWKCTDNSLHNLSGFVNDLLSSKKIETWKIERQYLINFLLRKNPKDYSELAGLVYEYYGFKCNKEGFIWGDKNNYYINHVEELKSLFPNAKFLHLIRDGRDVACSYKEVNRKIIHSKYAPNLPNNIEQIANEWLNNNLRAINTYRLISAEVKFIKYEDLILNTKEIIKEVCNFLSISFDSQVLDYFNITNDEPIEFLQWKAKTLERPDPKQISRYRKDLDKEDIKVFNHIANDLLKKFNYI